MPVQTCRKIPLFKFPIPIFEWNKSSAPGVPSTKVQGAIRSARHKRPRRGLQIWKRNLRNTGQSLKLHTATAPIGSSAERKILWLRHRAQWHLSPRFLHRRRGGIRLGRGRRAVEALPHYKDRERESRI